MSVKFDTFHFKRSMLNDSAPQNMPNMFVTRDTSHFETSALKIAAEDGICEEKMRVMSMTLDTSHLPIVPSELFPQSPSEQSLRQASTALCNSSLDFGANAGVVSTY